MRRVIIIGNSRIARKRVIPALAKALPGVAICIASRSTPETDRSSQYQWFDDYHHALRSSHADLAYISLHNSAHEEWARCALEEGLHVVVDKPAFLSVATTERLAALAIDRGRLLAESTVFMFHPQFEVVASALRALRRASPRVNAAFSFPALPSSDFRNQDELGGGALWDLGPYAVASGRVLFGEPPTAVHATALGRNTHGVTNGFSVLLSYGDRGAFTGHFGFGTSYINLMSIVDNGLVLQLDRAFTTPADAPISIVMRTETTTGVVHAGSADSFERFWLAVIESVRTGGTASFLKSIVDDAVLLSRVRSAIGEV